MPVLEKGQAALVRPDPVLPIGNPTGPPLLARGPLWTAIPPESQNVGAAVLGRSFAHRPAGERAASLPPGGCSPGQRDPEQTVAQVTGDIVGGDSMRTERAGREADLSRKAVLNMTHDRSPGKVGRGSSKAKALGGRRPGLVVGLQEARCWPGGR